MRTFTLFLTLTVTLLGNLVFGQDPCPPNIDFEKGDFSHWECFIGSTFTINGQNVIKLDPSPPVPGRHDLITASSGAPQMDFYGGFPTLCPYGGTYSVKLGNDNIGAEAEGLSYTFTVPTTIDTFTFTYFYAVVFEDPAHLPQEQPRFFVTAYDVNSGEVVNCASYNYVSRGSMPGFEVSKVRSNVLFKRWSPASLQFAGMKGRTVRLEFKTADCTLTGHFGYAYVDVGSACSNILATAPYCVETNSLILNAPYGFDTYTWYNQDFSAIVGNAQTITLSPPPATTGTFWVDVVPYPGFGCRDTLSATVMPLPVPDTPSGPSVFNYCQYQVAPALTATPLPGNGLMWYTSEFAGIGTFNAPTPPTNVAGTFIYYVAQKVLFGCESRRKKITVNILPTPNVGFMINDSRQCLNGNQFVFTSTTTDLNNAIYYWDFGDGEFKDSAVSVATHTYKSATNYYVRLKVTNTGACSAERILNVSLIPKPISNFTYPAVICEKQTQVALIDGSNTSDGFSTLTNWWWDIGGSISSQQNPSVFIPNAPGPLKVNLVVTTSEGCKSDTAKAIMNVHYRPAASFSYSSLLCDNEITYFTNQSILPAGATGESIIRWNWEFDNGAKFIFPSPSLVLPAGAQHAKLIIETNFGCKSTIADSFLTIYAKPQIKLDISDSCVYRTIKYNASDLNSSTGKWYWDFGNGLYTDGPVINKSFPTKGARPFRLIAESTKGCKDTLIRPFVIYDNKANAGRDTIVAKGEPVQLNANGDDDATYIWSPGTGLNDASIESPVAILDRDQLYQLDVYTKEGCDSHSQIFIKRYKGPELYIPNAFTPNADGKNDILKVFPIGIRSFTFFAIYNRYGEMIFKTTDYTQGWDGTYRGIPQDPETFVVIAQAIDYKGNVMSTKGTVILLR